MRKKIRAIPTKYNGICFKSKLEAKWANWFDENDIKWDYETQGFDVNGFWYLPDFYLPETNTIIEVKGAMDRIDKAYFFYINLIEKHVENRIEFFKKEQSNPEDWDYELLKEIKNCINTNQFTEEAFNQLSYGAMDEGMMFLLAGPVPHFYNINPLYEYGFALKKCEECGVTSIITKHGNYSCRSCGDHTGVHGVFYFNNKALSKPLLWRKNEEKRNCNQAK